MSLLRRTEITFAYEYGQVYLHDAEYAFSEDYSEYLDSLDEAKAADRSIGVLTGFVDILMPCRFNEVPLTIELHDLSPAPELDGFDHVIEFDLNLPSGTLVLEESGGGGEVEATLPPAAYRVRWSGVGLDAAAAHQHLSEAGGPDRYRLQAWPSAREAPPSELKRWVGYDS